MKTVSNALLEHLGLETKTLALGIKITRTDGTVLTFTDHDVAVAMNVDGAGTYTYLPGLAGSLTAIDTKVGLAVDNINMQGVYGAEGIDEADLINGLYDYAEVKVFQYNWADTSQGVLKLQRGWLGEHTRHRNSFEVELRGLLQAYNRTIGQLYSPLCRAELGDSRCKVDLAPFLVPITVATTPNPYNVITCVEDLSGYIAESDLTSSLEGSPWFAGGSILWNTGDNVGRSYEIKDFDITSLEIRFFPAMTFPIEVGDTGILTPGCDKRFGTCRVKYSNHLNFRGEPYLPGLDIANSYRIAPRAR